MASSYNTCSFCKRRLSEEEQTIRRNVAGLCHECYHLRRLIRKMNWHKKRVGVSSDLATEKRILSWFGGGSSPQKR